LLSVSWYACFFHCYAAHRLLRSFPTRRSSDLYFLQFLLLVLFCQRSSQGNLYGLMVFLCLLTKLLIAGNGFCISVFYFISHPHRGIPIDKRIEGFLDLRLNLFLSVSGNPMGKVGILKLTPLL